MGGELQPDSSNTAEKQKNDQENPSESVREVATAVASNAVKRKNRGNLRKRPAADSGAEDGAEGDAAAAVSRKAQKPREAPLAFSTKRQDKPEPGRWRSHSGARNRN